eukprot:TRINITY_DN374_c0_g1_i2.p1 TRINITY_DN374_c0_g1~~TRINITY_DN374_c0_g1_i2.p1  ORF type:complete len:491 (-),score=107.06 TRINITY_DN374_c0_g1_i2:38-1510(-)
MRYRDAHESRERSHSFTFNARPDLPNQNSRHYSGGFLHRGSETTPGTYSDHSSDGFAYEYRNQYPNQPYLQRGSNDFNPREMQRSGSLRNLRTGEDLFRSEYSSPHSKDQRRRTPPDMFTDPSEIYRGMQFPIEHDLMPDRFHRPRGLTEPDVRAFSNYSTGIPNRDPRERRFTDPDEMLFGSPTLFSSDRYRYEEPRDFGNQMMYGREPQRPRYQDNDRTFDRQFNDSYERQRRYTEPEIQYTDLFMDPNYPHENRRMYKPPYPSAEGYTGGKVYKNQDPRVFEQQEAYNRQRRYTASDIYEVRDAARPNYIPPKKNNLTPPRKKRNGGNGNKKTHHIQDEKEYKIDLELVRSGKDERSTLMIKNIPNKYDQALLLETIDESFANTYDFFYLPMDFETKGNQGYAFINFLSHETIPDFFDYFDSKAWPKFKSNKICKLRYGRLQGRRDLYNHFMNSRVVREYPEYRPVMFGRNGEKLNWQDGIESEDDD